MKELLKSYDGEIFLSVDEDNFKAINLYKKNNFRQIDIGTKSKKRIIFMVRK